MKLDRFDELVHKLNGFLVEEDRLYRMGWKGYVVQLWNSIFSKRVFHPIYSEPNLTNRQKDIVCLGSDVARTKADAGRRKAELIAQYGKDGYDDIIRGFDKMYEALKLDFHR